MSIFVETPHSLNRIMGCHGNHAISHNQMDFLLGELNFLPLSGLIEPFDINKNAHRGSM